jgi:hypothetical protein
MDCNRKEDYNEPKLTTSQIVITEEEDVVSPPPPVLVSKYKTLEEWLVAICDNENPKASIDTYNFGVFESEGMYTVYLVGMNRYKEGNHLDSRIEFEPSEMYFPMPKSEHEKLEREQVLDNIKAQLKDFINSEKFRNSFFARAKSINVRYSGEIWSK